MDAELPSLLGIVFKGRKSLQKLYRFAGSAANDLPRA
jgi:hypothetical protein